MPRPILHAGWKTQEWLVVIVNYKTGLTLEHLSPMCCCTAELYLATSDLHACHELSLAGIHVLGVNTEHIGILWLIFGQMCM